MSPFSILTCDICHDHTELLDIWLELLLTLLNTIIICSLMCLNYEKYVLGYLLGYSFVKYCMYMHYDWYEIVWLFNMLQTTYIFNVNVYVYLPHFSNFVIRSFFKLWMHLLSSSFVHCCTWVNKNVNLKLPG